MRRFTQLISHSIQAVLVYRLIDAAFHVFSVNPPASSPSRSDILNRTVLPEASFVSGQSQQDQILHTVLSVVRTLARTLIALSGHTLDVFFQI